MNSIDIETGLRNNLLFNLSLGSKELFHSNLLSGLFGMKVENGIEFSKELISKLFLNKIQCSKVDLNQIQFIDPSREEKSLDLILRLYNKESDNLSKEELDEKMPADNREKPILTIVIENKLKSIPNKNQLKLYEGKIKNENTVYFLLSLIELKKDKNSIWNHINYENVHTSLKETLNEFKHKLPVIDSKIKFKDYIEEYLLFLSLLLALKSSLKTTTEDNLAFTNIEKFNGINFKKLRLHDLLHKIKYERIKEFILENLSNEFNDEKYSIVVNSNKRTFDTKSIYLGTNFTHGSGLVDLKLLTFSCKEICHFLVIQLQSNHLRYASEIKHSKDVDETTILETHKEILSLIYDEWLMNDKFNKSHLKCVVKDHNGQSHRGSRNTLDNNLEKTFNKYDQTFYYKYQILNPEQTKIKSIIDSFIILTKHAISIRDSKSEKIEQIIKKKIGKA